MEQNNPVKWNIKVTAEWFEDAVRTMRRLPPVKVQGYHSAWPPIIYSEAEKMHMDKKPMRIKPTAFDISRMELAIDWLNWIDNPDERKLIWERAKRKPWKVICWELGVCRMTAWRKWTMALTIIITHLNNTQEANYQKNKHYLCRYFQLIA